MHQQSLHRRRARRQERAGYQLVVNSSDDESKASADIQITCSPNRQKIRKQTLRAEARHTSLLKKSTGDVATPRRTDDTRSATADQSNAATRHKRRIQDLDAEDEADRAATEIVELVDQELLNLTTRDWKGVDAPLDRDTRGRDIADTQVDRTEVAGQEDDEILAWVIAASKTMSREVTHRYSSFFEIKGNVRMETVGRRQSSARYIIFTARQGSKGQHSNLSSHMVISVSLPRHTYSNKHYW